MSILLGAPVAFSVINWAASILRFLWRRHVSISWCRRSPVISNSAWFQVGSTDLGGVNRPQLVAATPGFVYLLCPAVQLIQRILHCRAACRGIQSDVMHYQRSGLDGRRSAARQRERGEHAEAGQDAVTRRAARQLSVKMLRSGIAAHPRGRRRGVGQERLVGCRDSPAVNRGSTSAANHDGLSAAGGLELVVTILAPGQR